MLIKDNTISIVIGGKQSRVYIPEEPFPHGNLVKCGRLKSFKNLYDGDFSTEYRQPCVMFAGKYTSTV